MFINLAGAHARFSEKNQKSIMHIKFYVFWSKNANMKFKHPYLCRLRAVCVARARVIILICINKSIIYININAFWIKKFNYKAEMVVSVCVWQKEKIFKVLNKFSCWFQCHWKLLFNQRLCFWSKHWRTSV